MYYGGTLYGSGAFYSGSGVDRPELIDFYRTNVDDIYTFYWVFQQAFIGPTLANFDYQLQIDTDPAFSAPLIHETTSETASIITSGESISGSNASINVSAGLTLDININGDGVQTIVLALNTTGALIAADIQAKVTALIAVDPVNQPAYSNFTATFNIAVDQYTLTSGSGGFNSTVVISGGTAATSLKLGVAAGGLEVRGNSTILSATPRRVLIVQNSLGVLFTDVSSTTGTPAVNQYIVNLTTGQVSFNSANVPDTIKIIYVAATSQDITSFQRGNVAKAFSVPIYDRINGERRTLYARVRAKSILTYGPFSATLTLRTLEDVVRSSADRMLIDLPDRHVYPVDESFKNLSDRKTNIAKIYEMYGTEFDRIFLDKEHTQRDPRPERTRDERLDPVFGSRYGYPKPSTMEFVDYRLVLGNARAASLQGGTFNAVKLIGRAFTGVDPSIIPLSSVLNFITASETETVEDVTLPFVGPATVTLSGAVRSDPIIPGTLISGPTTTVAEVTSIPTVPGPYTVTLANRPDSIPVISGFTYTTGTPAIAQFAVNFATGVLTFNAANAGAGITITYTPFPSVGGNTLNVNVDFDGIQTITLAAGPFASKAEIAADVQAKLRAVVAITPANQPAYTNARVTYNQATNRFVIISGNQNPSPTSSVLVTGGTAATKLKLLLADAATQTFGLTYRTPTTYTGAVGEFRNNIDTGDGSLLTFNIIEYGNKHTVIYKKKSTVYSYVTSSTLNPPVLYSRTEAGFAIVIVLNNPGNFTLDLTNIAFLLKQILPAHIKFILRSTTQPFNWLSVNNFGYWLQ